MSRDVPFNPNAKCDTCGRIGAYDFMGDYICTKCSKIPKEDPIPSLPEGPADGVTQTGWQDIKTHPTDDKPFRVRMRGGLEFNVTWQPGFMREDETKVCSFVAEDGEPYPECWTDGVYWRSNADDVASEYPTIWMPLPPPPQERQGD